MSKVIRVIGQFGNQSKVSELESRSHAATDQRIVSEGAGRLPDTRGNDRGRLAPYAVDSVPRAPI